MCGGVCQRVGTLVIPRETLVVEASGKPVTQPLLFGSSVILGPCVSDRHFN